MVSCLCLSARVLRADSVSVYLCHSPLTLYATLGGTPGRMQDIESEEGTGKDGALPLRAFSHSDTQVLSISSGRSLRTVMGSGSHSGAHSGWSLSEGTKFVSRLVAEGIPVAPSLCSLVSTPGRGTGRGGGGVSSPPLPCPAYGCILRCVPFVGLAVRRQCLVSTPLQQVMAAVRAALLPWVLARYVSGEGSLDPGVSECMSMSLYVRAGTDGTQGWKESPLQSGVERVVGVTDGEGRVGLIPLYTKDGAAAGMVVGGVDAGHYIVSSGSPVSIPPEPLKDALTQIRGVLTCKKFSIVAALPLSERQSHTETQGTASRSTSAVGGGVPYRVCLRQYPVHPKGVEADVPHGAWKALSLSILESVISFREEIERERERERESGATSEEVGDTPPDVSTAQGHPSGFPKETPAPASAADHGGADSTCDAEASSSTTTTTTATATAATQPEPVSEGTQPASASASASVDDPYAGLPFYTRMQMGSVNEGLRLTLGRGKVTRRGVEEGTEGDREREIRLDGETQRYFQRQRERLRGVGRTHRDNPSHSTGSTGTDGLLGALARLRQGGSSLSLDGVPLAFQRVQSPFNTSLSSLPSLRVSHRHVKLGPEAVGGLVPLCRSGPFAVCYNAQEGDLVAVDVHAAAESLCYNTLVRVLRHVLGQGSRRHKGGMGPLYPVADSLGRVSATAGVDSESESDGEDGGECHASSLGVGVWTHLGQAPDAQDLGLEALLPPEGWTGFMASLVSRPVLSAPLPSCPTLPDLLTHLGHILTCSPVHSHGEGRRRGRKASGAVPVEDGPDVSGSLETDAQRRQAVLHGYALEASAGREGGYEVTHRASVCGLSLPHTAATVASHPCPLSLFLPALRSRSCRMACKTGDPVSDGRLCVILRGLSAVAGGAAYKCAHGRNSIVHIARFE
ncbi:hypothetical protein KIPB_003235 [Kipferlia bialata]|nr:hypothetical protein KIPB_002417 [Kipferlia bialata]GIQ82149.1 hypothetical protein KIPB_003235 [Kipferlia bialata]|eukprot:g2417.t1